MIVLNFIRALSSSIVQLWADFSLLSFYFLLQQRPPPATFSPTWTHKLNMHNSTEPSISQYFITQHLLNSSYKYPTHHLKLLLYGIMKTKFSISQLFDKEMVDKESNKNSNIISIVQWYFLFLMQYFAQRRHELLTWSHLIEMNFSLFW